MRESQQRRQPASGKRNWTRGFSLMDKGDRIEECGGQGKERTRKWKKRNDRIHSEVRDLSAVGEVKQRWETREKSSLRETSREGIARRSYMDG